MTTIRQVGTYNGNDASGWHLIDEKGETIGGGPFDSYAAAARAKRRLEGLCEATPIHGGTCHSKATGTLTYAPAERDGTIREQGAYRMCERDARDTIRILSDPRSTVRIGATRWTPDLAPAGAER